MSLAHPSLTGHQLGAYHLLRPLGVGGMAEIYLGEVRGHASFRKRVAIKVLHAHLASNEAVVEMFESEARITASLDHPNIVQVYDLASAEGRLFMVAEYVPGLTLRQALRRLEEDGDQLEPDLALSIAVEIGRALRHAHGDLPHRAAQHPPIVHRDLSPDNVMIAEYGGVKLLDFGVAKTLVGDDDADRIARGKWAYMSPEQVRGEPLDGRSDLFGLGALIYEMLTGQRAFGGASQVETMRRVEQAEVAPAPGVDPLIESLLERLLARDREDRFPNASAAVVAMRQVQLHRAGIREQPELAGLVERLIRPPERESSDRATVGLRGPGRAESEGHLGVDLTGQLTIPVRGPVGSAGAGPVRPPALAEGFSAEVTDPFGADQTTLPPQPSSGRGGAPGRASEASERPRSRGRQGAVDRTRGSGAPRGGLDEEDLETTAARSSSESVLGREGTGRPSAPAPAEGLRGRAGGGAQGGEEPAAQISDHGPGGHPSTPSVPEVFFDHFLPEVARPAEPDPGSARWSRKNVLTLTLAILAILIAALAILLALRQHRRGGPPGPPRSGSPRALDAVRRGGGGAPHAVPEPRPPSGPMASGARRGASRSGAPRGRVSSRALSIKGPMGQGSGPSATSARPEGLPHRGQLDVLSSPEGAEVLINGVARGTTPVRLRAAPGRALRVMLTLPGYRLYKGPVWMPSRLGRRVRILLPKVTHPARRAAPGGTALQVVCKPGRHNRVYLDGQDTGLDCPTPRIAVLPTVHMVSVYLPASHRVRWKKVHPRRGETAVVSWEF